MTPYTLHNTVFIITVEIISCLYTIIHFFYKILRYTENLPLAASLAYLDI